MSDDHGEISSHHIIKFRVLFVFLIFILLAESVYAVERIRVGIHDNPPKVFVTPDGFTTGLYPEILKAVAMQRGWFIEYVPGTWQQCLDRLENNKIDIVVDIAKTSEREEKFLFTKEPVLTNWGTVYARKHSLIHSFEDMRNKQIAVVKGSVHTDGSHGIQELMRLFDIPCQYVEVNSCREALMLLDSSQADACVVNRLFGTLYADNYEIEPTPIIFNPRVLFFAGQKNTRKGERLTRQIDESLRQLKQDPDSIYHKIMGYYLSGGQNKWLKMQELHLDALNLTKAEKIWLKEHPVVRIGIDPDFAPFEFISDDGRFIGMASDYLSLLSQKTGIKFEQVRYDTWGETIEAVKHHEIDILPCVGITPERKEFLLFTDPYIKFSRVIITPIESSIQMQAGLDALKGYRVGVQQNSSHHGFIKESPFIKPYLFTTFQDAMVALSSGKIDAVIGNLAVATHVIKELSLTNLKFFDYAAPEPQPLSVGVRNDWPELTSILNRALETIRYRERYHILSKWFPLPIDANIKIDLTREEREWLLMNPRIRVAWDRNWAPIEFSDAKDQPKGIAIDHLLSIGELLGLEFDMGQDIGWQESMSKVEKKEVDMLSCVAITPERMEHLNFTQPYLDVPVVIFGPNSALYVRDLSELKGKKVAVVEGYATDAWLSRDYPKLNLVRVSTIKEAFGLLTKKKVDAFIGNLLPGNFYLSQLKQHDIKIIGETRYSQKLRMAVRNDWPQFVQILQKALDVLPEAEKTYFYRKWAWVKYEKGFDYDLFKKIMVVILAIVLLILLWNRYMAAEIRRRKKTEEKLSQSEFELRASNRKLKKMETLKENLAHMIAHDMRSPLMGIGATLQFLSKKLTPLKLETTIEKNLLIAQNGVATLNRMLQSFLDVFKLESDELILNLETLDIKDVVQKTVQEMQTPAKMYNQQILLSGESLVGTFDPEIIRRILINLIENALKASSQDGKVRVHTTGDEQHIVVEVSDTGYGISPQFQETIFDKFASVKTQGSENIPSYGLGLAFCKLAVDAHKGKIEVESKPDAGSTFRIRIPRK